MVKKLLGIVSLLLILFGVLFFLRLTKQVNAYAFPGGALGSSCTIAYPNISYNETGVDPSSGSWNTCNKPYECRVGQFGSPKCLEIPPNGSVLDGMFCYNDTECQSGYCFHPAGVIGAQQCQTKCSAATCNGTCNVSRTFPLDESTALHNYPQDVNQCIRSTPTPTPIPTTTLNNTTISNTTGICDSVTTGVIKIEYSSDPGVCWQANTSQRVKITCNDGSQKTQATQSGCYNHSDWVTSAKIACANNTTCSTANIQAAACPASGIKLITPITSCATAGTYTSVSFICNDGYSQQLTNGVGICQTLSDFTNSVMPLCNNHKVCPTPTPTNTPTPTPTEAAATPIPKKSCDANGDGITNQDDLQPLEDQWFGQSTSKTADCNKDGVVNGLDFQMWRDIWILKQS